MRKACLIAVLTLLLSKVDAKEGLGVRVNKAIDRGAAWLVTRQHEDGSWNKDDKVHPLGRTALCTYALLHAGYERDHPAVEKALRFLHLSRFAPRSTYEAGCLLLLLHALGPAHDKTIHFSSKTRATATSRRA